MTRENLLVIVGYGGRSGDNTELNVLAEALSKHLNIAVRPAFLEASSPSVGEAIQDGVAEVQPDNVIVVPLYVGARDTQRNTLRLILDAAVDRWPEMVVHEAEALAAPHPGLQTAMIEAICERYESALAEIPSGKRRVPQPHSHGGIFHIHNSPSEANDFRAMLPPRYQGEVTVSAAPMGAADLVYGDDGRVAWDQIWGSFCDLALAGGPPHRGTLLEPVSPQMNRDEQVRYLQVLAELERGVRLVTKLPVVASAAPGWIGVQCADEEMALWLLRAIIVENVSVRREGDVLYLPAGPDFRLEHEIKNVITVIAKTHHYWTEHLNGQKQD